MRVPFLQGDVLVQCLDFLPDASILELAVASPNFKCTLIESQRTGGGGPWRHPIGTWQPAGLWRALTWQRLKMELRTAPAVLLSCRVCFHDPEMVLKFLEAAKAFASETVDGSVVFHVTSFDPTEAARLSWKEEGYFHWCAALHSVVVLHHGLQMECTLEAHNAEGVPRLHLGLKTENDTTDDERLQELGLCLCCRLFQFPYVKLKKNG